MLPHVEMKEMLIQGAAEVLISYSHTHSNADTSALQMHGGVVRPVLVFPERTGSIDGTVQTLFKG